MKTGFWYILKCFGIATGVLTTLWFAFKAYDNIIDGQADMQESIEYLDVGQTFMMEDIALINDSLEDIVEHQVKQDQHMNNMEIAAKFYIDHQQEMTNEAMEDALEILLKKNGLDPIVFILSSSGNTIETESITSNLNQ